MKKIIVTVLIVMYFSVNANTIYVDFGRGNDSTGNVMTGARFKNLQPAIDAAVDGDIILVEAGKATFGDAIRYVYLPTDFPPGSDTSDLRNRAFHNDGKHLAIFGGNRSGSYFLIAPTILSGDFNNDDDLIGGSNSENAYHVFVLDNVDDRFRFDRIEFRDGNANGTGGFSYTMSSPLISQNQGAGLYIVNETPLLNANASPLLIATLFSGNHADVNGGALYNHNSSPQLFNSVFNDNTAGGNGAGIYNDANSVPQIINNTFIRNDATGFGGGLFNQSVTPVLVSNTVFYDNTALNGSDIGGTRIDASSTHNASDNNGGGIATGIGFVDLSTTSASAVFEDILNPEIFYSTPLVNGNTVFIESAGFVPVSGSPLFNTGLTSANTLLTTIQNPYNGLLIDTQFLDPFLHPRVTACMIDIGAFEVSENIRIHVDAAAPDNTGDGSSWDTALRDLQFGIDCATDDDTVLLAQGIYKPTESPDETTTDPRNRAFHIDKSITVKGGYDPVTGIQDLNTPSILSGDFLDNDVITGSGETLLFSNNEENAYHVMLVVLGTSTNNFSNFENLTIQGGNANNSATIVFSGRTIKHHEGAGMFFFNTKAHLDNMIIRHNKASTNFSAGGGIWNDETNNVLTNIQFIANQASQGGGLFTGGDSGDLLTNVVFSGKLAEGSGGQQEGGGMNINTGIGNMVNTLFYNNHANGNGGGFHIAQTSSCFINNVSFILNSSGSASNPTIFRPKGGGGLYYSNLTSGLIRPPVLRNTVFFGNTASVGAADLLLSDTTAFDRIGFLNSTSSHNASDGTGAGIDTTVNFTDLSIGSGLIASDIFTNFNDPDGADNTFATADDGLVPLSTSPLVNIGDNAANTTALDLANVPRVYQTTIDKGAYEYFVEGVFADGFE
jgi:hypothetical protein